MAACYVSHHPHCGAPPRRPRTQIVGAMRRRVARPLELSAMQRVVGIRGRTHPLCYDRWRPTRPRAVAVLCPPPDVSRALSGLPAAERDWHVRALAAGASTCLLPVFLLHGDCTHCRRASGVSGARVCAMAWCVVACACAHARLWAGVVSVPCVVFDLCMICVRRTLPVVCVRPVSVRMCV